MCAAVAMSKRTSSRTENLTNVHIAELLATEAEASKQPLQKALRRASRKAFLWPEEAAQLVAEDRSLEELPGIGPYLHKLLRRWVEGPPLVPEAPEIRRGFLSIPQARAALDKDPSWSRQLKGDLQMHSTWSDGSDTVAQLAASARDLGHEYIAITDHSKGLKIAGGIDERQLGEQAREIAIINHELEERGDQLRVLRSVELNLNPLGEGDMDAKAMAKLDLVLGCFHSALRRKEDQTDRYLAALRNPSINTLGHPRGRIYNFRLGLIADWDRVFALAAELDKAVEIDCYPDRQDLSLDLVIRAKKAGCRISLGTDAHGASQLRFVELGLASALMAGIPSDRILNFMSRERLIEWAKGVRESCLSARRRS